MTAAAKTVSALPTGPIAPLDAMAGPALAAMVLPTTMMMGGFVAMCGFGYAFARAFAVTVRDEPAPEAARKASPVPPRLVVSNDQPLTVVATRVEAAKPTPAKPSGVPPKPTTPGGSPPKPKAAKALSPKESSPSPKAGAVKAPVAEVPAVAKVEAAKPAPAKPTGTPPKPTTPGGSPPKPKMAASSKAKAATPAGVTKKVAPMSAKPLTIETTSTPKGISLPKVSFQKKPGGTPGKN